jgi:dihydrodipicolinate synthase/N-acetylneuraminate lyase
MVGVDTNVYHGFVNCGATGAITGIGNALPREVLHLVDLCKKAAAGDAKARVQAKELEEALGVLSSFDEGPDLVLYYKHLMVLNGDDEYTSAFQRNRRADGRAAATMPKASTSCSRAGMRTGAPERRCRSMFLQCGNPCRCSGRRISP